MQYQPYLLASQPLSRRPQPRAERERILRRYDLASLAVAYKVTLKLPLSQDVSHIARDAMIPAILDAEYGRSDSAGAHPQRSLRHWSNTCEGALTPPACASWTAPQSAGHAN